MGEKLFRMVGALVLVVVVWGVPARASAQASVQVGAASSSQCVDVRPGPAPVIDRVGAVGVPRIYCYNPADRDHKDWHDYCSVGQGDTWSKGGVVVSFRGSCAYHDLCLEYGWGFTRSSCDAVFRVYMLRNCDETVAQGRTPTMLKGLVTHMCREKAERMYLGVHTYTTTLHPSYRSGPWGCLIRVAGSAAVCSWRFAW